MSTAAAARRQRQRAGWVQCKPKVRGGRYCRYARTAQYRTT